MNRAERRKQAQAKRRWLSSIAQTPGKDPETVTVAAWIASRTNPDGTITDPLVVRLLHEVDAAARRD
ncbi:hypothetical protein NFC73_00760 [Pseudarthrobacter sp. RMG13]|uniref:Antitoxin VbhA domain-containing protein n=1 Tax=Pseudarthrobacter humi TaxID=2952523 RepID=A0ABT1LIJ0_9MICC|nr:hypothetical protein [Pseudarthrobacter humi]MCP8998270.1 hypothetical protein [Pseudarthrobacter humi]